MPTAPDIARPAISVWTGQLLDREIEHRFRVSVLPDWQVRLRANVAISALALSIFGVLDYDILGWSQAFQIVTAVRLAFIVLAGYLLVTQFTPENVAHYDRCALAFGLGLGAAFCAVASVGKLDVMAASVAMIAIILQLYQFIPNRPVMAIATVFPVTALFLGAILLVNAGTETDDVGIVLTLLVFNVAGAVSVLRVARLQRLSFATHEARDQILAQLVEQSCELAAARDEANHANRAKSEFLAHMSHELRSPLNAINGFSEIIKDELFGPVPPRYREYGADIHRSGMLLTALINDVLDLSKIEAGKLEVHDEIVVPADAVDSCFRLVRDRAFKAGLALRTDLPAGQTRLRADDRLVKQMLLNLLTNAIKFTPEKGEVRVVGRMQDDGGFALAVQDTGIGIAAQDIEYVLEPYGQVEAARDRNPDSTGLGLPLVKKMIELHGGSFRLDSTPGVGTTATLIFPPDRVIGREPPAALPLAKAG